MCDKTVRKLNDDILSLRKGQRKSANGQNKSCTINLGTLIPLKKDLRSI